jgi:FkbM family methyltransferase
MWIEPLLRERSGIFVDVGAHIGFVSVLAMQAGYRPITFEPQFELYCLLARNADGSHLPLGCYSELTLQRPAAAQDQVTDLMAWDYARMPSPGSVTFVPAEEGVPFVRLDDAIEAVDFLKVDAQGADLHVLRGAENILLDERPLVVFEREPSLEGLHGVSGWEDYEKFFARVDYDVEPIEGAGLNFVARPRM